MSGKMMINLKAAFLRYISAFGALALSLVLPRSAQALELEYYTYGGFSDVVSAFTKSALVFSDSGYMVLATTIFIGALAWGLFKAGVNKLYAAVPGEGGLPPSYDGVWSAILNALVATVLFFGLIVPKGTLHIYDPTENQYQAVGGIPLIGVISAGASSMIERALVEIVETSGSPLSFSKQAGIKGIQVMNALMNRGGESISATFEKSLDNYIQDCVYFELKRPGSTLKIKELSETTPSIMETSFPKAVNPAISTVVFAPDGDAAGITTSCTDAWTDGAYGLSPRYTAAIANPAAGEYKDLMIRACKDAGYSTYDPNPAVATAALNTCVTNTNSLINTMSPTWSLGKFIGETRAAYRFMVVEASDSPALVLQQNKMTAMTSQLAEFLQGLATKRGVIVAMAAVALPFVCLLLFTQGYKMILGTVLAMFILPSIWGILMAAVSDFYLSNMVAGWTQILDDTASGGKGVMALGTLGSDMLLGASYWGLYLTTTFGIAMTLASKLSSSAAAVGGMARAQGNMMEGNTEMGRLGMGASERQKVATSEGAGLAGYRMADNMANAMTGLRGEERLDFGMQTGSGIAGAQSEALTKGLVQTGAYGKTMNETVSGNVAANSFQNAGGAEGAIAAGTYDKSAQLAQTAMKMATTGGDFNKEAAWKHANDASTRATFKNADDYAQFLQTNQEAGVGKLAGEMQAYKNAQDAGFKGDWKDFHSLRSEISSNQDFARSAEIVAYANKHGVSAAEVQRQIAAGQVNAEGEKARVLGKGDFGLKPMGTENAQGLYKDLSALGDKAGHADFERLAKSYGLVGGAGAVSGLHGDLQANKDMPEADRQKAFVATAAQAKVDHTALAGQRAGAAASTEEKARIGQATGKDDAAAARNQDVEAMSRQFQLHQDLDAGARADMNEKMAEVFREDGQTDAQALMTQFGSKAGAVGSMVLTQQQADVLNKKLGGKANFKKDDVVAMGMGADGSIKFASASRGGYALDRSGHTTERLANLKSDTSSVFRSGTDREHFIKNITTVASGVNFGNSAQASLNNQLRPYTAAAMAGGKGSEWDLYQAMAKGHEGMYSMKGQDVQIAAVKAAAAVEGSAGIGVPGFSAKFKTSLEASLQGQSSKAEGVDMVAHVYKATGDAAKQEAEAAGFKPGSSKYNEHVANRLSTMTGAFEGAARGQRGYGMGAVTGSGPTGNMPNNESPLPRDDRSHQPIKMGPATSTLH